MVENRIGEERKYEELKDYDSYSLLLGKVAWKFA